MVDLSQLSNVLDSSFWHLLYYGTQCDWSYSLTSELRPKDLVRKKWENRTDLRVEEKKETGFEISAFQRIRASIAFRCLWLVWQPQHDLWHTVKP